MLLVMWRIMVSRIAYLMQRLSFQQVEECLFVGVDGVKMCPMVEECLYHCRFCWLVQSCRVKGGVAILNKGINIIIGRQ